MANTYTQIHIQAIFAVKKRTGLIQKEWKNELYKYITGIIQAHDHKLLAINGMPDHIHVFFGMRPIQSLSDLMQDIKQDTSKWINRKKFIKEKFEWSRLRRERILLQQITSFKSDSLCTKSEGSSSQNHFFGRVQKVS